MYIALQTVTVYTDCFLLIVFYRLLMDILDHSQANLMVFSQWLVLRIGADVFLHCWVTDSI